MSDSKIEIKVGIVEFSGEGNQEWLATQLDKILGKVPELLKIELNNAEGYSPIKPKDAVGNLEQKINRPTNLASFLKEKNSTTNQVKKFLATAAFLQLNGKSRLSSTDVKDALKNANQTKLGNPSDCLNQNVKKGHCEKDGGTEFFVTSDGFAEIGIGE